MLEKKINKYFPFIIICFLASDFLTSISYKLFHAEFYRYSGLVKLTVGILITTLILIHLKQSSTLKSAIILTVSFIIGQFYLAGTYDIKRELLQGNIYFFSRYMYILLFVLFFEIFKIHKESLEKTYLFFEYILWTNAFFIIVGLIFQIEIFKSFEYTKRFGYSGLFSNPGEASYLYMIAIIFTYYKWQIQKRSLDILKIIVLVIIAMLLGQKKIFLFLFLIIAFYFYSNYKKFTIISFPFIATSIFIAKKEILNFILELLPYWKTRVHNYGFIASITSYRNILLEKTIIFTRENWTPINYIFGGVKLETFKTEFGFFDIFFFLGFIGIVYYLYIYSLFIKNQTAAGKTLVTILFITSFFSGGLLLYPTVVVLFYIILNVMYSISDTKLD